jgi:hypothetical protein
VRFYLRFNLVQRAKETPMLSWEECPEASGPSTEGAINGIQYGDHGYPSIGQAPRIMSIEQRDREWAEDERKYQVRLAAERAALAAGQSALEAAATASKMLREAGEIAAKVAVS